MPPRATPVSIFFLESQFLGFLGGPHATGFFKISKLDDFDFSKILNDLLHHPGKAKNREKGQKKAKKAKNRLIDF